MQIIVSSEGCVLVITDYKGIDMGEKKNQVFKIVGVADELKQQQYYSRCNFKAAE